MYIVYQTVSLMGLGKRKKREIEGFTYGLLFLFYSYMQVSFYLCNILIDMVSAALLMILLLLQLQTQQYSAAYQV